MKGLKEMSQTLFPQYHSSYSEEDNLSIHEYLISATEEELVRAIYELANLYSDTKENKVKQALDDFAEEIKLRYEMKQRYDKLLKCRDDWKSYLTQLDRYYEAREIRLKYQKYKEKGKPKGTQLFESFLSKEYAMKKQSYDVEFIRKATFSENSKKGIHCPQKPRTLYTSLSEVPIEKVSREEALEQLGKENLKLLITILLRNVDEEERENKSTPIIQFLTRAFSYENHKKGTKPFSSKLKTYNELRKCCLEYIEELKSYL